MKELLAQLDALQVEEFQHQMKDNWNAQDFEYNRRLVNQINELKKTLRALGWEG